MVPSVQRQGIVKIPGWPVFYVLCGIVLTAIAVFVLYVANSTSFPPLDLSSRVVRAEARRKTHSSSIDSEQGKVMVLDITTGSEFLRIIAMPNSVTIAASGWANQWDEEQVRELVISQHQGTIKEDN
jgi:hypothetical protein